jgi:DNA-binding GntR family transcriptional regulator
MQTAEMGLAVKPLEPQSLVDLAADAVRTMILAGALRPGDRLVESHFTERLGISRPPLREALRLLQHEGLVQALPRRGAMVTVISAQDAWEISTLRSSLERTAMELYLPLRGSRGVEDCRTGLEAMAEAANRGNQALLIRRSFEFHVALVALAGHRRLTEMYRSLSNQMLLCMALNVSVRAQVLAESLVENVDRHRKLLELVKDGDLETVLLGLREHGERTFLGYMKNFEHQNVTLGGPSRQ